MANIEQGKRTRERNKNFLDPRIGKTILHGRRVRRIPNIYMNSSINTGSKDYSHDIRNDWSFMCTSKEWTRVDW